MVRGITFYHLREPVSARTHLEQGLALYDPQQHHAHATLYVRDPGVVCGVYLAQVLWFLGYPDQALARSQEALSLAQALGHPLSLAHALEQTSVLHWFCRDVQAVRERAEACITLVTEQDLGPWMLGRAMIMQGGALVAQGQEAEGMAQMQQGLTTLQAIGGMTSTYLSILAELYLHLRQAAEGLRLLPQESQTDWLRGELLLRQARPDTSQAETCFQQALNIARTQQAKSLELRAATSLARLWQAKDKRQDAYDLLAPVHEWFTEGFDTADLEDAKALLSELRIW
jgi:predicted ATPase